jgi:hypothetical protein
LLAADQPVLVDPVERPADQFVHAFRPHPRRHPHFPAMGPRCDALFERFDGSAPECDFGQMKCRHVLAMQD